MSSSEEEYIVETIAAARAAKTTRKKEWEYNVKWKDYEDPSDNTWEPAGSFKGGSEHFIDAFWENAVTGGRDYHDLRLFKHGEKIEYFPVGPPRKKKKKQTSAEVGRGSSAKQHSKSEAGGSRSKRPLEVEESIPEPPPRKKSKARARDPSPPHEEPSPRRARGDVKSRVLNRAEASPEVTPLDIGESASFVATRRASSPLEELVVTERVGPPKRKRAIPAHRQKAANPRVKRFEPDMPATEGGISVKARLTRQARQELPQDTASNSMFISDEVPPDHADNSVDVPPSSDLDDPVSHSGEPVDHEGLSNGGRTSKRRSFPEVAGKSDDDLPDYTDNSGPGRGIAAALNFSFGASAPARNRTSDSPWGRPRLFNGPLGSRSDIRQQSVDATPQPSMNSKPFTMRVDTQSFTKLSLILQDDSPHLLQAISHSQEGPTGIFYTSHSARALMSCLRADGRCARVALNPGADPAQEEVYARFLSHLKRDEICIFPVNQSVFVFSLPQSSIQHLLKVPPDYLNDNNVLLVSQVSIQLPSQYADTVVAATTPAW